MSKEMNGYKVTMVRERSTRTEVLCLAVFHYIQDAERFAQQELELYDPNNLVNVYYSDVRRVSFYITFDGHMYGCYSRELEQGEDDE